MYYIAHCDDSELEHEISELMIDKYSKDTGNKLMLDHYMSGTELLDAVKAGKVYDICLLDYIMPEIKGVELADKLRKMGYEGYIIFISSTTEYVMDAFDVRPFYCLEKPVNPEKMRGILDSAIDRMNEQDTRGMILKTDEGERYFKIKDILYVTRFDRSAQYVLTGGQEFNTLKLRSSFQEAVSEIAREKGFVMLGTLLINLDQIALISKDVIIFKDGTNYIPPAVHLKTIRSKLNEFWTRENSGK